MVWNRWLHLVDHLLLISRPAMEHWCVLVVCLIIGAAIRVACELEIDGRSDSAAIEPRYDHYEMTRYWWPWFSDVALVIFIKLKIWIVLVAMLVFGDGYYWAKTSGPSIFEQSQWVGGWGRRKRRSVGGEPADDPSLADRIFNTLEIGDDSCRKWVVCELYLEAKRVPAIWETLNGQGYEVFRAYRPKQVANSSAECRKQHPCVLVSHQSSPKH
ncbi:uncharacterized protein LOC131215997 [Anopheles bellator]|uniref:uncharacterized protein LOC131215997 n=1 Tax=Anopheles bellator TaxID=139047 RepID=UPI002649A684|nr:uncharacterized protein LOC131215997 [Anopheles bellator]